jgi:acyl dehydratase
MAKRPCIENRTFDEISIGDEARLSRTLAWRDIELFAAMSGDVNPAHVDAEFAKNDMFHRIIAHGMWGGALISTVLGTELPGPGTIYLSQSLEFRHPIGLGDTISVQLRAIAKDATKHRVTFDCTVTNQASQTVISGTAEVIAPNEKICRERVELPVVKVYDANSRA